MRLPLLFMLVFLLGCGCYRQENKYLQTQIDSLEREIDHSGISEDLTQAVLWYQFAPEVKALYYQGFNMAKEALRQNLRNTTNNGKKNAVIVDIDETILNNSLYQGWLVATNNTYSGDSWTKWVLDTLAKPLPGAVDFINFAANNQCEVFYVSNRKKDKHTEATLQNLKKYNLPFADEKHLFLKSQGDTSDEGFTTKEKRRNTIAEKYNILLLLGDQLADFNDAFDVFESSSAAHIEDSVFNYREEFGSRFILFPNPIYSDWLGHILYGSQKWFLTPSQMDSVRRSLMIQWGN